jgi:hypothetical protein
MATGIKCSVAAALATAGFILYQTAGLRGRVGPLALAMLLVLGIVVVWGLVSLRYLHGRAGEYIAGSWLATWSTVVTFVVVDLLAAALLLPRLSPPIAPDPVTHHRLLPGSRSEFRTSEYSYVQSVNSAGFRGPELRDRGDAGLRILMLGDSFTMGKGVSDDETFSALLEARLRAATGRPAEVINSGVDSYAPILEYLKLTQVMPVLQPDVVVMNLDPGDGVQEVMYRQRAEFDADGRPRGVPSDSAKPRSLADRVREFLMRRTFMTRLILYYVYEESGLTPQNVVAAANPAVLANTLESDAVDRTPEFEALFASIQAAADLCARHGVRFVLAIYPWGHQVGDDEWRDGRRHFVPDGARASDRSRMRVREWASARGIELVDAFDAFRQAPSAERLYFDADMHWTPRGHEIMADVLFRYLQKPVVAEAQSPPVP